MTQPIKLSIRNILAGGDYTGTFMVGSPPQAVHLLLDTGSSALGIKPSFYDPNKDTAKTITNIGQQMLYGTGGWDGPVLKTTVTFAGEDQKGQALDVNVAIAYPTPENPHNFGEASGILGLAFRPLDNATRYFEQSNDHPVATWPYDPAMLEGAQRIPSQIDPFFSALEQAGVVANQFALYTLRSMVRHAGGDPAQDPANQGYLILGGGEEFTDLYQGHFSAASIVHPAYYNTNLLEVTVGAGKPVSVAPPPNRFVVSNSIVDSGTNSLALTKAVYDAIFAEFSAEQQRLIQAHTPAPGALTLVPGDALDLSGWPTISFVLAGPSENVTLEVSPQTYWQTDTAIIGKKSFASFGINDQGGPNSILGLPLLNNYFTIFDRSAPGHGRIMFAKIQPPASPAS
ncbi:MAG: pepsin-like aspartic protease [Myxococcota bacterium]